VPLGRSGLVATIAQIGEGCRDAGRFAVIVMRDKHTTGRALDCMARDATDGAERCRADVSAFLTAWVPADFVAGLSRGPSARRTEAPRGSDPKAEPCEDRARRTTGR
jgi:hypothetical protein